MKVIRIAFVIFIVIGLLNIMSVMPCRADANQGTSSPQAKKEPGPAPSGLNENTERQVSEQRKKITQEAVSALDETRQALAALKKKKTKDALTHLERASGKLNIVLARDPKLALAPIDVTVKIYDVATTPEAIENAKITANEFLDDGDVQKARHLLRDLASEIVISVVNIPLKTYPTAIAAVAPMIDQGRIDDAKTALQAALNTLVVADHIIPLPVARTKDKLAKAEQLSEKEGRSEEESKTLQQQLTEAREQLKLAEALGYGNKNEYQEFYAEIDDIERRTAGGKAGKGWFDKVKQHLKTFAESIFE